MLLELGKYGVGIHLNFCYVKYMAICFFIMSLISIPYLVCNLMGNYYENRSKSVLDFTTLGNQDGFEDGTIEKSSTVTDDDDDIRRYIIIYSDVFNTIMFFFYIYLFKYIAAKRIRIVLKETKTASDYSIYVNNLPAKGVTERDVIEHFAQYGKVVEVIFARKFGNMMNEYKAQGVLNKKIFKQETIVKIIAKNANVDPEDAIKSNTELLKLKLQDNEMEKKIRDKYPDIKSYDDLPSIGCFVVFDDVEACNTCYKDYQRSNRITYKNRLKLLEQYKIEIEYADDPANINWENLEANNCESMWRTLVVYLLTFVLLTITFIAVYFIRAYQNRLPEPTDCEKYIDETLDTVDK